jgi:hypothetical protein
MTREYGFEGATDMTDHELKKLSRAQLLEMLLAQSKEVARLRKELQQAQQQLDDRRIQLSEAGNIAEAALKLNGVFAAAQSAAADYLDSISESVRISEANCRAMEEQTKRKCDQMVRAAQAESAAYWDTVREKVRDPYLDRESWQNILELLDSKPGDPNKVRV